MSGFIPGTGIRVIPDGVRLYGTTNLQAAQHVAQAGAFDLQANVTSLSPAMGLIGADFLASFIAAQSEHTRAMGQLSLAYASNGVASHEAAAAYELTVADNATDIGRAGGALP
ncbi:MAG: hypothetical protein GXY65_07745 [Rhodococcus sp.]|uniref:type VII secretion target n=1 Tax=Rhodococcus TaxID=1827 RepID=UPI0016AF9329|nr:MULTISPECIES: type VII secretion target [Rhodococcus]NLV79223.1 hypothetical protein [Rhodococcus sp. (in: high G+C Gram-positive bacteria)]